MDVEAVIKSTRLCVNSNDYDYPYYNDTTLKTVKQNYIKISSLSDTK